MSLTRTKNSTTAAARRRPTVAGRQRGSVKPSPVPRPEPQDAPAGPDPRRSRLMMTLLVLLVVFSATAVTAGVLGVPASDDDTRNAALVDAAATSDVLGQVNKAVETVFSYDFSDTAKTRNAAQNLLRDNAVQQYNQLFGEVTRLAPAQQLVLTTTIRATAVTSLAGDEAHLLVLADQRSTRGDTNQTSNAAAQLSVVAKKTGDTWRISDLTVL
ncbi:hypothetical protein LWP59_25590 [Amycolatopsis acidiphila]|uniref:Mce-associated membrane protein n=1 Tax=Amycolatopsis acidiphila TaxID=715473 RepID=A0A558AL54_9PSEU|nr:hypothetical protein [Amycolatopsis acidiphila]TVT24985.1 hypothetical protein FNH06_03965 [Amycolatopsis acidiphila]UIJ57509.1 hypothetical protein LWP59_25590 [Amycolatopsis acidiphila]GHG96492.1 hypothetical protein GCM10017788_75640 [Amycolatopsis acidiphila]